MSNQEKALTVKDLPTIIYAKRQISFTSEDLYDPDEVNDPDDPWYDPDEDNKPITMEDVVDRALDYANDYIGNANVQYYLIAEWHATDGRLLRSVEYDWSGNLVEENTYTYPEEDK